MARQYNAGAAPTLVAVSKRQPADRIEAALVAGHRVFEKIVRKRRSWAGGATILI